MSDSALFSDPVALTEKLISFPSVTPEDAGCLEWLSAELEALGFVSDLKLIQHDTDAPAVQNLFAHSGEGKHLCFAGHTDVVPAGQLDAWKTPPFEATIKDGVLYGRGAEDMKAAIAAFSVAALRYRQKNPTKGRISLFITGDEEGDGGNGSRAMLPYLQKTYDAPTLCLVGEPTNPTELGQMIKIGRRGSVNCVLTVKGKQGHVAYPALAENPVRRIISKLYKLQSIPLDEGTEFFPPSNLEVTSIDVGNQTHNLIPEQATARFNVRFNDLHRGRDVISWINEIFAEFEGDYHLDARVSGEAFHTDPDKAVTALQKVCQEVTGRMPELSTTGGTSDARFIKDWCPVIEFGTTGKTAHQVNECVAVEDIKTLAEIYYRFLLVFFKAA